MIAYSRLQNYQAHLFDQNEHQNQSKGKTYSPYKLMLNFPENFNLEFFLIPSCNHLEHSAVDLKQS
jgi:hypothetical protein